MYTNKFYAKPRTSTKLYMSLTDLPDMGEKAINLNEMCEDDTECLFEMEEFEKSSGNETLDIDANVPN